VILKNSYPDQIDPIRCCFEKGLATGSKVNWITWSRKRITKSIRINFIRIKPFDKNRPRGWSHKNQI